MDFIEAQDLGVSFAMGMLQRPWLTWIMKFVGSLGETPVLFAVVLAAMMFFFLQGRWRTACCLASTALIAYSLNNAVKQWVHRPRPDLAWMQVPKPTSFSFPSGRALLSMAVYGGLALSLAEEMRRRGILARLVLFVWFSCCLC